jgi:glycosyltransferase involved in cell wall biosynthesis
MALPRESLSRLPGKTDRVLIGRGDARCHEHAPQHSGPKRRDRDPGVNEAAGLERSVTRLRGFVADELHYATQITIADNASTDATLETALRLADSLDGVGVLHLDAKGRGRALRAAWGRSGAEVLAYMDVDLSTDLRHLRELVEPCLDGDVDIAIGSRLARGARVSRGVKRELISRSYNAILKGALATGFSDAQCGFKAGRREAIHALLPQIEDQNWFFDTELLFLAERHGMRIHEIPVHWVEDPDSRVKIIHTALEDLRGIHRLRNSHRRTLHPTTKRPAPRPAPFAESQQPQGPLTAR